MDPTRAKKILIVDDEPDVVAYLCSFFEDNGFEVIPAYNGKEAFDKAVSEKPDLISLDITMPEESGLRTYRDLQETEATKDIPVVIVTGVSYGYKSFERFMQTRKQFKSPAGFFEKPIDRDELLAKVKGILGM